MKNTKIFFTIVVFIAVFYFYIIQSNYINNEKKEATTEIKSNSLGDWLTYEDNEHMYSLKYPATWEIQTDLPNINFGETARFVPSNLNNFPECQRMAAKSLENRKKRVESHDPNTSYTLPKDYADRVTVYNDIKSTSCSISIRMEENLEGLSIKEFLKEKFLNSGSYDTNMFDYIESLSAEKDGDMEKITLNRFFYYVTGFGEKEGDEEEAIPYFSIDQEYPVQFIITRKDLVVFVNNNINKKDYLLPENKNIFKNIIENFDSI